MPNQLQISPARLIEKAVQDLDFSLYVDRGDPAFPDFSLVQLITDGAWHDLDLSGIVPVGTKFVDISTIMQQALPDATLIYRAKGNTNQQNSLRQQTQASGILISIRGFVLVDTNRVIEYWASNVTWSVMNTTICGWIL